MARDFFDRSLVENMTALMPAHATVIVMHVYNTSSKIHMELHRGSFDPQVHEFQRGKRGEFKLHRN